jgi:hypothetical protein
VTWTYDPSDLSDDVSQVRVRIGDTNTHDKLLSDEELQHFIDDRGTVLLASVSAVRAIIAKLARNIDRSNIGMSAQRSQSIQHYRDLLRELERESGAHTGAPRVGGISKSDKATAESDSDRVAPTFFRGQWDKTDA